MAKPVKRSEAYKAYKNSYFKRLWKTYPDFSEVLLSGEVWEKKYRPSSPNGWAPLS
jgi:hypothetical protein